MLWLKNPIVEIAMPAAIKRAPLSPSASPMIADAGVFVLANISGPSTYTQTKFTER